MNTESLTFASMNCQGLGDMTKRRDVFHFLRLKKYSIYLLQDTHFNIKQEKYIESEWGYNCYFASFKSNSRGVAVLFNNNFDFKIKNVIKDPKGNFIIININTLEKDLAIVSLYGPNNDNPQFYIDFEKHLIDNGIFENIIISGDWNLVMNLFFILL